MGFPRILVAVPLLVGGIFLPALGRPLDPVPHGVIGMSHDGYVVKGVDAEDYEEEEGALPEITIHVGQTITFQNNSRWIHVVGPGDKGILAPAGHGSMTPRRMMEENDTYTTPPWDVPGSYLITCTVHPDMNAKVVVLS